MKAFYSILILLIITFQTYSQKIQLIDSLNVANTETKYKDFFYLNSDFKKPIERRAAIIIGIIESANKNSLINLFHLFWKETNNLKANSFFVENIFSKNDTSFIKISVYQLSENEIIENYKFFKTNMIYLFGDLDKDSKSIRKVKVNKVKYEIKSLECYSIQNTINNEVIIGYGGLLGAKYWIKGEDNKLPKFLFFVGPGIGGAANGVSFNSGRMYNYDINKGSFLMHFYKQSQLIIN